MFIKDLTKGGVKKMENKLKPCPFCGGEARIHSFRFYEDILLPFTYHYKADVICANCNTVKVCSVVGENEEDCKNKVAEEWNKRYKEVE